MGLADKLADIIRPRPAGLFSGPAPASTTAPGLSAASILSGAASEIARGGVRAFMRALETMRDLEVASHLDIPADDTPPAPTPTQSPVKITWGGVPLRGFADDEYFSIEIDKRSQQAGRVVGLRLVAKGASRQEAYAHAMQAETEMRAQLQAKVDAGESLPSFHDSLLKRAGFDDVAARGTPPPIVLSHPRVPISVTCQVEGGLPTEDGRKIRETIRQVFHEQLPAELARGIREAKPGIMY